jgi:hypothetical protein
MTHPAKQPMKGMIQHEFYTACVRMHKDTFKINARIAYCLYYNLPRHVNLDLDNLPSVWLDTVTLELPSYFQLCDIHNSFWQAA